MCEKTVEVSSTTARAGRAHGPRLMLPRRRAFGVALAVSAFALLVPAFATAQNAPPPVSRPEDSRFGLMRMLLERTVLKVDVLTLEVRVDSLTAARLERVSAGKKYSTALADSITAAVLDANEASARIDFLRGASFEQFVSEVRSSMSRAVDAGLLQRAAFESIGANLPVWYAFLDERGVRTGDAQTYGIRGDTLQVTYTDRDGTVLLDYRDVGESPRRAVLGSYFAPRSDFREKLVKSLLR